MIKIKKRVVIEILMGLLVLAAGFFYCYHTPLSNPLQLVLTLKVNHHARDTFRVVIGDQTYAARLDGLGGYQDLSFQLPMEKIENLDIHLGLTPGIIAIQAVKLKGAVVSHTITGKKLKALFQINPSTAKYYLRKNNFCIETTEILHWVRMNKKFLSVLQHLQADKLLYYLLAVLLALVVFYWVHFMDVRHLKIFFNAPVLLGGLWIWLLFIYFPLAEPFLKIGANEPLEEKRQLHKEPPVRFEALPHYLASYTKYYNDYFALRGELIFWNSYLKLKIFGISATDRVLVGKGQWLFFHRNGDQPSTVDYYRNLYPFTEPELRAWKNLLEARQKWLAARGIDYLFLIVPIKNTIYPEYMPDHIKKVGPRSRFDQLLEYMKKHSTVKIPDIRPAMSAAKGSNLLFFKTDSHWNYYGSFVGQQALVNYMSTHCPAFKEAQPVPLSRLRIQSKNFIGGDLAIMLSLHQDVLREDNIEVIPVPEWSFVSSPIVKIAPFVTKIATDTPNSHLPNILMVHDSFYKQLQPYLSELFPHCLYIWDWGLYFYPEIIEREKPALVIDEMAERFLLKKEIPANPGEGMK